MNLFPIHMTNLTYMVPLDEPNVWSLFCFLELLKFSFINPECGFLHDIWLTFLPLCTPFCSKSPFALAQSLKLFIPSKRIFYLNLSYHFGYDFIPLPPNRSRNKHMFLNLLFNSLTLRSFPSTQSTCASMFNCRP